MQQCGCDSRVGRPLHGNTKSQGACISDFRAMALPSHGEVDALGGRKEAARHDELPSAGVYLLI